MSSNDMGAAVISLCGSLFITNCPDSQQKPQKEYKPGELCKRLIILQIISSFCEWLF